MHDDLDALKRIQNSQKINADDILKIDAAAQSGRFYGSDGSVYSTTLSGCTCVDFERRGLPCKHIYRLASELGHPVTDCIPRFDPYAAAEYDVEADISRLRDRLVAGQLTWDAFVKCADALHASAGKAKKKPGRPRKNK